MSNFININLNDISNNINSIRKKTNKKLIFVAKGNVYGFGFNLIPFIDSFVDKYAVSSIQEAYELKKKTQKMILILSPISVSFLKPEKQFVYMISSVSQLKDYCKINYSNYNLALKLNTGLNRYGISKYEDSDLIEILHNFSGLKDIISDVYTHLSATTSFDDKYNDINLQYDEFINRVEKLKKYINNNSLEIHSTDSAYLVRTNNLWKDISSLRTGMYVLGLNPIFNDENKNILKFPLCIQSTIVDKHIVNSNEYYGYEKKSNSTKYICTIPMGYCDGISKKWINKNILRIEDNKFKFIDVAMNSSIIEVTKSMYNNIRLHKTKVTLVSSQEELNYLAEISLTSIENILNGFYSINNIISYEKEEK